MTTSQLEVTAGLDLGDRYSHLCLIDTHSGEVIEETRLATNPEAFERRFLGLRTDPHRYRSEYAFSVGQSPVGELRP